jgi:predicted ATP-grasp superfamily ATP-dependent carboligase
MGRGLRVVGLSCAPEGAYGHATRACEIRPTPSSQEEPEAFADALEFRGAVIFPTRDADVLALDRYRGELSAHFRLAIPPHACLARVLDKQALTLAAKEAGVPVPRTITAHSEQELERVAAEVGYPCVLKPVSSMQWRRADTWARVGARKAFRAESHQELAHHYRRVSAATTEVLIQELIPGDATNIVIMGGYVGRNSEPLAFFTARKLIQTPDDFGTGCLVRSEEIPEIVEQTKRLWKNLKYHGMAEVEYKLDGRSGEYRLIEINTRHWDWHQLGGASGINLTWVAYCDATGRPPEAERKPIRRALWIAEDTLAMHVLSEVAHGTLRVGEMGRMLSGARRYGIYASSDPMPLFRSVFSEILPGIGERAWRRLKAIGNHG